MIYTSVFGWLLIIIAIIFILFRNNVYIEKKVISIYFALVVITFISFFYSILVSNNEIIALIGSLWAYCVFGFVLLHSSVSLGKIKTTILFIITLSFGLISEFIGVKFGLIFGHYYYNPAFSPFFFGTVPLMTVISWAIIIYMSYTITNIILRGFITKKPNIHTQRILLVIPLIIILSSIDGLIAVNLDMILDPVAASHQLAGWIWLGGGPYFGIPISNFIGWFLVTFSATIIFRIYESVKRRKNPFPIGSLLVSVTIVSLYLIYFLTYAIESLLIGNPELVLIGTATMFPFILIATLSRLTNYTSTGDKT